MKKVLSGKGIFAAIAALLLALVVWAGVTPPVSVVPEAAGAYDFNIEKYDVKMSLSSDGEVQAEETIYVSFTGYSSHGIIRDFPLGSGVRYSGIEAKCNHADFSPYIRTDDSDYLSLYLRGNGSVRGQERVYTVTYTMTLPASRGNRFPLDVIGYGWGTDLYDVTVELTVPDGLNSFHVYSYYGGTSDPYTNGGIRNGNTITVYAERLPQTGITLDLDFKEGAMHSAAETPLILAILIGGLLVAAAALVKVLACRQPVLVRPVNLDAPNGMDPLMMGKLIDNSVDSEDMGSLIFWLASEGYLRIDLSAGEDDPTLIRTEKPIPSDFPPHCRIFYEGLFARRERVSASQLNNSFYRTADQVKTAVNAGAGKIYTPLSQGLFVVFLLLSVLFLGGFSFLYPLVTVGYGYHYWGGLISVLLAFFMGAVGSNVAVQRYHKWKTAAKVGAVLVGIGAGCLVSLFTMLFPCAAFTRVTIFLIPAFACAVGCVAGTFSRRNEEYNAKLGQILGFKQFILFTERDKIEFMLKENPELYYKVLPYAQVLGITDAWTDKFDGLNMEPPAYVSYSATDRVFTYLMMRSMFRSTCTSFARTMVSRPSSRGGGGGFGGSGGSFGGGGFGGGGGRGC